MNRNLLRRRIRVTTTPPPSGDYSGARYQTRYPLPRGVTLNPETGLSQGYPHQASRLIAFNEITLADQGTAAANRTLLQTTLNNAAATPSTPVTIKLDPTAASWGDEVGLPGVTWGGVGTTIMSAGPVRAEGSRHQVSDRANMPTFIVDPARNSGWYAPGAQGTAEWRTAIRPALSTRAANWRLIGLRFRFAEDWSGISESVQTSTSRGLAGGYIQALTDTPSVMPLDVGVHGCSFEGVAGKPTYRGMFMNGGRVTVRDSHFEHFHYRFADSQCILLTAGAGPDDGSVVIENNYLAAGWGENVMIGGGTNFYDASGVPMFGSIPHELLFRRNFFTFPDAYRALGMQTKMLLECKGGRNALVESNIFDGHLYDNGVFQNQFWPIGLKYSNMAGHRWNVRANLVRRCHAFALVQGVAEAEFSHNLFDRAGVADNAGARMVMSVARVVSPVVSAGPPETGHVRNPDGFTMRYNSLDRSSRGDNIQYRQFMVNEDPNTSTTGVSGTVAAYPNTRTGWRVQENVIRQWDAVDDPAAEYTFTPAYLGRSGSAANAAALWAEIPKADSEWNGNVVSGIIASQSNRAIPGDIPVQRNADLMLDANWAPLPGSPCTGKGADIPLLTSAVAGVETGL